MSDERIGQRVELHPATDRWMRGDRFGTVVGIGRRREYIDREGVKTLERPLQVRLDKSGETLRFHPENVSLLGREGMGDA